MATCKECMYYLCCTSDWHRLDNIEHICSHFKDKTDFVSQKAYEQVKWERDTAIEQLKSYGVGFCEDADVVRVVRCKNCKHYKDSKHKGFKKCNYSSTNETDFLVLPDDFCNYGERDIENE